MNSVIFSFAVPIVATDDHASGTESNSKSMPRAMDDKAPRAPMNTHIFDAVSFFICKLDKSEDASETGVFYVPINRCRVIESPQN